MTFEEILSNFRIEKRNGNKVQCKCPCHEDKKASMTITKNNGKILIHCHAGCSTDDILANVGLTYSDLHLDDMDISNKWKRYVESRAGKNIEAVYNYSSLKNNVYAFTKVRLDGKEIIYGLLNNDRFTYGLNGKSKKDYLAVYGNLHSIRDAINRGNPVFIPEGEKDVDTLTNRGYVAFTYGGVNDWQSKFSELVKDAIVYILADNDEPGKKVAATILNDIKTTVKSARIVVPMPDIPKGDITDFFESGYSKEDFEKLLASNEFAWPVNENNLQEISEHKTENNIDEVKALLNIKVEYDNEGNVKRKKVIQSIRNHEIVVDNDYRFTKKIMYNEFSQQLFLVGTVPWECQNNYRPWGSQDDSALFSIIQSEYGLQNRNDFYDAIKNVSRKRRFNPVKDVLNSLEFKGIGHIRNLLPNYLGTEDSDYNYEVMKLFMLGAVNRIYRPGCKFDYAMILQGPQGIGKSTFLQLLALDDAWFNDSLDSLDSDKAAQSLMGSWIIELAELKSLARTAGGVDSVKRFLSATQDKYRIPYERRSDIFPRQCVFAGTTNKADFLQDETGNRRFLIIRAGEEAVSKDLFSEGSIEDIKAAWAEAVHIFKKDNPKLVLPEYCMETAKELQEACLVDDGKKGLIEEYLTDKLRTCVIEIWEKALHENGRPAKWQSSEIANVILSLDGWKRMKSNGRFGEYGLQKGFEKNKTDFVSLPENYSIPFE